MPRYKPCDRSPKFVPLVFAEQIEPGSFEYALDRLVDEELDFAPLDARYRNDVTGASAYDPRVMLKIVLLGYARGLVSSRAIAQACDRNVQFMAVTRRSYIFTRFLNSRRPVSESLPGASSPAASSWTPPMARSAIAARAGRMLSPRELMLIPIRIMWHLG